GNAVRKVEAFVLRFVRVGRYESRGCRKTTESELLELLHEDRRPTLDLILVGRSNIFLRQSRDLRLDPSPLRRHRRGVVQNGRESIEDIAVQLDRLLQLDSLAECRNRREPSVRSECFLQGAN